MILTEINQVYNISPHSAFKEHKALEFPEVITQTELSKKFQPQLQEGRRIPINLQDKVYAELKKYVMKNT